MNKFLLLLFAGMQCSSMFADNVELTNDHREDVKYTSIRDKIAISCM